MAGGMPSKQQHCVLHPIIIYWQQQTVVTFCILSWYTDWSRNGDIYLGSCCCSEDGWRKVPVCWLKQLQVRLLVPCQMWGECRVGGQQPACDRFINIKLTTVYIHHFREYSQCIICQPSSLSVWQPLNPAMRLVSISSSVSCIYRVTNVRSRLQTRHSPACLSINS